jgi:SAM-dependent methyltransferase
VAGTVSQTDPVSAWRPLGSALVDYHNGDTEAKIIIASELWEDEPTPVAAFYRPDRHELPELERRALELCRGRVLDLGAGAGRHSLELQSAGHDVVAVDPLSEAVAIMTERGVRDARRGGLDTVSGERFDTVLALMHGLGIIGDLHGLGRLLHDLPGLLEPGGRLIGDSADLSAVLADEAPELAAELSTPDRYLGEVEFRLRYRGREGAPYPWLFVDPATLELLGQAAGTQVHIDRHGDRGSYLAVLEPISTPFFTIP